MDKKTNYLVPAGQVLILWMIMLSAKFCFGCFRHNEYDVLPYARQFIEKDWLLNDWFLNLKISYRYLFNLIFGPIISLLGFEYGTPVLRSLAYLFIAVSMHRFFRTLTIRFSLEVLILYYFLQHQSVVAGEWMVGGVETKAISYAFVLLSLSALLNKRYKISFAFSGLAFSFHALVGLYAVLCTIFALLLNGKTYQFEIKEIIRKSWLFPLTGMFGIYTCLAQLLQRVEVDTIQVSDIYVRYRAPHHLLPNWGGIGWKIEIIISAVLFLFLYVFGRTRKSRFIAAYALSSIGFFVIGIGIYLTGYIHMLKYYWFRFADVMVPFVGASMVAMIIEKIASGCSPIRAVSLRSLARFNLVLSRAIPFLLGVAAIFVIFNSTLQIESRLTKNGFRARTRGDYSEMFKWINQNTSSEDIFLIDPTIMGFYVGAQRAEFVSFHHFPQSETDIKEWYKRIKLINHGTSPKKPSFSSLPELRENFYGLDETTISNIAKHYNIRYYLGLTKQKLSFKRVHSVNGHTLYRISTKRQE
jgi:hypothetical protein